jgi:hypothetical protein
MNFFEHMGYLLEGGYLNIEDVSVEFHYWILHVWADARKLIKSEQVENAIYYEFFEKMVNRLLEYDRPRTGALQLPTDTEIEDIYAEESHLPICSHTSREEVKASFQQLETPVAMLMIPPFNSLELRLPQENRTPGGEGSSLAVIVTLSVLQRAPSRRQAYSSCGRATSRPSSMHRGVQACLPSFTSATRSRLALQPYMRRTSRASSGRLRRCASRDRHERPPRALARPPGLSPTNVDLSVSIRPGSRVVIS